MKDLVTWIRYEFVGGAMSPGLLTPMGMIRGQGFLPCPPGSWCYLAFS